MYGFSAGTNRPNAKRFVDRDGLDLLLDVWRDPKHASFPRVREEIAQAARHLSKDAAVGRPAVVESGYIPLLLGAMEADMQDRLSSLRFPASAHLLTDFLTRRTRTCWT